MRVWKVGELARATGITVRTLHHYDQIGLLSPSRRSGSGYRLYAEPDIARLHRIFSLRQLGFSLEEIRDCLANPRFSPLAVIEAHIARLASRIEAQQELQARLVALANQFRTAASVSIEDLTQTLEMMTMIENYYTPDQLKALEARGRAVGEARIKEVEAEWPALIAEVAAARAKGLPPGDPAVQALARRWMGLVQEFTGGDPGLAASLARMYREQPAAGERAGVDPALFDYVGQAMGASRSGS